MIETGPSKPQILGKHQTRFEGFDDKYPVVYDARGMTTREIQGHLQETYGVEVILDVNVPAQMHRWGAAGLPGVAAARWRCVSSVTLL